MPARDSSLDAGAWGLLEDREQGFLARSVPLGARGLCQYHSLGLGCGVQVQGADRRLGCFWRPGGFFFAVWRALPTFVFALLQAECACQIQTQTRSFSRQVKTGIILATDDNPKSLHVAVCRRRPSTPSLQTPSPASVRAEASLFSCRL